MMLKCLPAASIVSVVLLFPSVRLAAETADPGAYAWTEEFAGQPLDLTGYALTFSDDFDEQSVTDESSKGPWLAPVHSDVGASTWDAPKPGGETYAISDGVLKIRASRDGKGKWHAGNIQTVDRHGRGFAQLYGYFEARMKFPAMPGAWCAFWLKSQAEHWNRTMIRTEIDVVEWYGGDPTGHHRTIHLRPARLKQFRTPGRLTEHWWLSNFSRHDGLAGEWHTYGALITPEQVQVYVDGKEVGRFPTLDEFRTPLYPLVSLTLYEKDVERAVPPFEMEVDYVRVYARR
jgi:beta-glucanase (GH16 family)